VTAALAIGCVSEAGGTLAHLLRTRPATPVGYGRALPFGGRGLGIWPLAWGGRKGQRLEYVCGAGLHWDVEIVERKYPWRGSALGHALKRDPRIGKTQ